MLLKHGADAGARDRLGRTALQLAGAEVATVLGEEQAVVRAARPCRPRPLTVLVSPQLPGDLGRKAASLGWKVVKEVVDSLTHLVTVEGELGGPRHLEALCVGAEVVGEGWLRGGGGEVGAFRLAREGREGGATLARERREELQPRVLAGLHVYLSGAFSSPSKEKLQGMVRVAGGKLLSR